MAEEEYHDPPVPYMVTVPVWIKVTASSKEEAVKAARFSANWEDWDMHGDPVAEEVPDSA